MKIVQKSDNPDQFFASLKDFVVSNLTDPDVKEIIKDAQKLRDQNKNQLQNGNRSITSIR
jgi:hypothetical protein